MMASASEASSISGDNIDTTLSEALLLKAETELGEKPKWRKRDVEALRDIIKKNQSIYCPHEDDSFLLMFLRARKFDYERASSLIERYYQVRQDYKTFYELFRPSSVLQLYKDGAVTKLPKLAETDPQPLLIRPGRWDPAVFSMENMFKANVLQIEKLIRMEENQVNGIVLIMDLSEMSWNHAKNMNPLLAKRLTSIIQYAMPCRLKGLHYVSVPHFFEYMFSIVKQFLSEKIQKRVHIYSSIEPLKEHFDSKVLPTFLGGELEIDSMVQDWADEMANSEEGFKSREKYGIKDVTTLSGNDGSGVDPSAGISGTFRKLNCD